MSNASENAYHSRPHLDWKRIKKFKNPEFKGPCVSFIGDGVGTGIADVSVLHRYVGAAAARVIKAALKAGKRKGTIG